MNNEFFKLLNSDNVVEVRNYFENIIAVLPGHIYWKDKNGVLLGCNDQQAHSAGLASRQNIIGKTDYELPWKGQADALRKVDLEVIQSGLPQTVEEISTLANGIEATFLSKKIPLYYKEEVMGIIGISIDITEKKESEKELVRHKLDGMSLVSASIAHELRTPLRTIHLLAGGIEKYLPLLIESHQLAAQANLTVPNIALRHLTLLSKACADIRFETQAAFTFIDMLLTNLKENIATVNISKYSMHNVIEEALDRYPFDGEEKSLIDWNRENDFDFAGNELLIVHVIFNLLKNALYEIKAVGKGRIELWTEPAQKHNLLHFKDTAKGINADTLSHIFERFFSNTRHGTGIGLTFCKMVMENLGGSITCISEPGDYAEFILSFPNY